MTDNNTSNHPLVPVKFNPVEIIATRRFKRREHTDEEIKEWISRYAKNEIEDYQMSAWLMAVCFNPLSSRETATLTRSMVQSGIQLQWPDFSTRLPLVDKHSTGGVGDKVSIVLAPLVAELGVAVPMMAGRGLGHTGGTIDKLESIPGFHTDLSIEDFQKIVLDKNVACAIISAGSSLCPADLKMYALRDVTATVSSIPLMTASIMSKKIAELPDTLLIDCKYGQGAFCSNFSEAEALAKSLVYTGETNDLLPTQALLTRMDAPLGTAVGNWLEIVECVDILKGNLTAQLSLRKDLITLIIVQAGYMLWQATGMKGSVDDRIKQAYDVLDQGLAMDRFIKMVHAQGGDTKVFTEGINMPHEASILSADQDGYIVNMDARIIGEIAVDLGAGRRVTKDFIDHQAGIVFEKRVGNIVAKGDVIAKVYGKNSDRAVEALKHVVLIAATQVEEKPIISHVVTTGGITSEFNLPTGLYETK